MKDWNVVRPWTLCLLLFLPIVSFASSLASPEEDRRAKQALPPAGQALLYVYRTDGGARVSPTVVMNNRELGALAPRTYYMVPVTPGRVDLRAGGETTSIRVQDGRVYFVHLAVDSAGDGTLSQVSYGRGRRDVHAARLVKTGTTTTTITKREAPRAAPETPDAPRAGFNLIVKGGGLSLASSSQSVLATIVELDATGTSAGVEAEWITGGGWAFGAEYLSRTHGYTSSVGDGDLQIATFMVNFKKYFRYGSIVQPYLGIGAGGIGARMTGGISGAAGGFAAQAMGGVAFRGEHFGVYTEIKYQNAKAEDDNGEGIDIGGLGVFAGVSVLF